MQYLTDVAEKKLNLVPKEEDFKKLEEVVPRIRVVERREGPSGGQ